MEENELLFQVCCLRYQNFSPMFFVLIPQMILIRLCTFSDDPASLLLAPSSLDNAIAITITMQRTEYVEILLSRKISTSPDYEGNPLNLPHNLRLFDLSVYLLLIVQSIFQSVSHAKFFQSHNALGKVCKEPVIRAVPIPQMANSHDQ